MADAEDVVHDAWLRWLAADRERMRDPRALLYTIVTRLSLNELKSARRRRAARRSPRVGWPGRGSRWTRRPAAAARRPRRP
ncbi:sigma factor, partial [Pseudomonas aeruginosa]|uniref:sigma factor n=1 Tax=Pseudomonas aeruginosa TaxID=287 RepID=UPI003F69D55D